MTEGQDMPQDRAQDMGASADAETGSRADASSQQAVSTEGFDPARDIFGIECDHHYGITTHPIPLGGDIGQEVYRLIREAWHPDLADDDHTFEIMERDSGWSTVVIRKNERSPRFAFKPWWCDDGPGALWFSQAYRVATRGLIQSEVQGHLSFAAQWQKQADQQRDTTRGRKARSKYTSLAKLARIEADLARSRWPDFDGSPRTGWQTRMHGHRDPAQTVRHD